MYEQNPENNIGQFRHNIVSVAQSNHKFPKTKMQKIIKIFAQKSYTSAKTRKYFRFEKSAKIVVEKSLQNACYVLMKKFSRENCATLFAKKNLSKAKKLENYLNVMKVMKVMKQIFELQLFQSYYN